MADWRDNLQPASFRGVPFFVETGDGTFGRRVHRVEYPYRDKPFTDDLGRRMREYSVEAKLLGDDLFALRTRLIEALEKPGPGTLIHPRLGALRVQVETGRWRHTTGGNIERFSITFVEASDESLPSAEVDTLDRVGVAADRAQVAQHGAFESVFTVDGQPDFVFASAESAIGQGMDMMRKVTRIGRGATDAIAKTIQTIDLAARDVKELLLQPRNIASKVSELIGQVLGLDNDLTATLASYRSFGNLFGSADPIPTTTPSRRLEADNRAAIAALHANTATFEAARLICKQAAAIGVSSNASSPFSSADEAYAVRDELVQALEAISLTADDALFAAVLDLQSAFVAHIEAHGQSLPRVERVTHNNRLPMLVIAHRVYGADRLAAREADLIARNRIRHPLFVPAGRTLEVLNG